MKHSKILLIAIFSIFASSFSFPQYKTQGNQKDIKQVILNSNDITTVLFNYGSIGKPNYLSNIADLAWHGLGYMFEFGPIAAAEVVNDKGDTLHITDDSFLLPGQGTYSPDGTQKWGWLPDSGYANPNQNEIATKNNPGSWASSWSEWPEFDGDTALNALNEAYFVMDDYSNQKFDYYPFPSDSSKRGLGLKVAVKIFQFGGALKDAIIIKYKITNESPKDLNKIYWGFQGDPHIGGSADYADDRAHVYFNNNASDPNSYANNTIYMWDNDMKGMGGLVPGYLGFKFLETPDNIGLGSLHLAPYTNSLPSVPKNSDLMWKWLSGNIDTTNMLFNQPGDNIVNFGTKQFSLNTGQSTYVTLAIFLSPTYHEMLQSSVNLYWDHNWPYITSNPGSNGGNKNYTVGSVTPNSGENSGNVNVEWNYTGSDANAKAVIEYSSDLGKNWNVLASDVDASSNKYEWNTENYKDGVNYLLRVIAYNSTDKRQNYYSVGSARFTINNSMNAQPELKLFSQLKDSTFTKSNIDLSWLSEDADNANLNIKLSYAFSEGGAYTQFLDSTFTDGNNNYSWNIKSMPNSSNYFLKISASDGNTDTTLVEGPFSINYLISNNAVNNMVHINGHATADFNIQVVDSTKINFRYLSNYIQ